MHFSRITGRTTGGCGEGWPGWMYYMAQEIPEPVVSTPNPFLYDYRRRLSGRWGNFHKIWSCPAGSVAAWRLSRQPAKRVNNMAIWKGWRLVMACARATAPKRTETAPPRNIENIHRFSVSP